MILYEDKEILVCHKPAGIPVQNASVREKDMVSILRNQVGSDIYVVHRLDQPVEGVLVFAKTKRSAAGLSRQITDGSMRKIYQAVVEVQTQANLSTKPESETDENTEVSPWFTLVDYLVKDGRNNRSFVAKKETKDAKRAELRYRILKCKSINDIFPYESTLLPENTPSSKNSPAKRSMPATAHTKFALVEIELLTGRHHQIRVQMAHAGLPLVGDRKYNPNYQEAEPSSSSSLALCAVSLTFRHPATNKQMTFQVQPQADAFTVLFDEG